MTTYMASYCRHTWHHMTTYIAPYCRHTWHHMPDAMTCITTLLDTTQNTPGARDTPGARAPPWFPPFSAMLPPGRPLYPSLPCTCSVSSSSKPSSPRAYVGVEGTGTSTRAQASPHMSSHATYQCGRTCVPPHVASRIGAVDHINHHHNATMMP